MVMRDEEFRAYSELSDDDICELDPKTIVAQVGEYELSAEHLKRILQNEWLTTDIICAAIHSMTCEALKFTLLPYLSIELKNREPESVLKHKVKRYEKRIIPGSILLIPLCTKAHWTLAAVDVETGKIEYFDSFQKVSRPAHIVEKTRRFLELYFKKDFEIVVRTDLPHQENGIDCGVYVVKFAQHVLQGIPLDFDDSNMPSIRRELCSQLRKLPDIPMEINEYRDVEAGDNCTDDIEEHQAKIDEYTCRETVDSLVDCTGSMAKLKINDGFLSYEDSVKLAQHSEQPFMGLTKEGNSITYNAGGDWKKMLSLGEILKTINPGNAREAWNVIDEEIKGNPNLVQDWNSKAPEEGKDHTAYSFRWNGFGNFLKAKQSLRKHHQITMKSSLAKVQKKKLKAKSAVKKKMIQQFKLNAPDA